MSVNRTLNIYKVMAFDEIKEKLKNKFDEFSNDIRNPELILLVSKIKAWLRRKQDVLISGKNIKTINGENILGSGNIDTCDCEPITNEEIDTAFAAVFN